MTGQPELPGLGQSIIVGPAKIQRSASSRHACWLNCHENSLTADQAEQLAGMLTAFAAEYRERPVRLIEEALHLRMNGERAPGGNETWADWDRRAEQYLREVQS